MNSDPKVSVIMSVYNGEKYLREAVDSILNQTVTDFEFIIINDGSTDNTKQILESYYDSRIRLFHQENMGLTKSLNKGISLAKGEYIARMDADDISLPERFAKQVRYLDDNPHVGLLGSRYLKIDERGVDQDEIQVPIGRDNIVNHLLLTGSAFCHSSMMFKRSLAKKVGFYDEAMRYAQDYDLGIRMFEICDVANHPEILQKWRYNTSSGISVKKIAEQKEYADGKRAKYIEASIAKGLVDFNRLESLCRMKPSDKLITSQFLSQRDRFKPTDKGNYLTYLQLKYLHGSSKWKYLNKIAEIYAKQRKPSLAFMCLVESLRLNPDQPNILNQAERLEEKAQPKFPERLKGNSCCISVIMPTYNRPLQIRDAIQSVLRQTFQDFELIIINDGGSDEVKSTIDSFDSTKIRYFKLKTNKGLAGALNEGILRAHGEYIAYLDDDDVYYPSHLESLINCQRNNSDYDFVYSNAWWCYGEYKGNRFKEGFRKLYNVRPDSFDKYLLFRQNYISTLNILHKKSCLLEVGLFNEDLAQLMDWELWLRFASKTYNFCKLNGITGEYRWTNRNMTTINNLDAIFLHQVIRPFYEYAQGKISFVKAYIKQERWIEAENIYEQLVYDYSKLVKTPSLMKDLFYISEYFARDTGKGVIANITKDFFKYDDRNCLNSIVCDKLLFYRLLYIIHLIPLKTAKKIYGHVVNLIKKKIG